MMLCAREPKTFSPDTNTARVGIPEKWEKIDGGSNLLKRFRVEPGGYVKLGNVDPSYCGSQESHESALLELQCQLHKMDQLQNLMYAERKHALLIVLQGLDACGKDGVVRYILTGMNPAGCRVVGFKQPTPEEIGHDFLWRVHPHVPARGEAVIFNRSHYEDVLAVRVHHLVPGHVWSERYDLINDLERLLVVENSTTVLKFFLHISKDEQLARFKRRLDDPARRWKISEADYLEREHWEDYMRAFEDMLHRTSTEFAPWFIIPSNHKWFRDLTVSRIITHALDNLEMQLPETAVDFARIQRRYHSAEVEARAQ